MSYTTTQINRNFLIKVYGNGENRLVGVLGLIERIGEEMASKLLSRAFNCNDDKCVCKLRRGLVITFYVH